MADGSGYEAKKDAALLKVCEGLQDLISILRGEGSHSDCADDNDNDNDDDFDPNRDDWDTNPMTSEEMAYRRQRGEEIFQANKLALSDGNADDPYGVRDLHQSESWCYLEYSNDEHFEACHHGFDQDNSPPKWFDSRSDSRYDIQQMAGDACARDHANPVVDDVSSSDDEQCQQPVADDVSSSDGEQYLEDLIQHGEEEAVSTREERKNAKANGDYDHQDLQQ